jgi:hypothetical protein
MLGWVSEIAKAVNARRCTGIIRRCFYCNRLILPTMLPTDLNGENGRVCLAVTLYSYIRKVFGLNLTRDTRYPEKCIIGFLISPRYVPI